MVVMRRVVLAVVLCAFLAVPGLADIYGTVGVKFTGVDPTGTMKIVSSGHTGTVYAGVYNLDLTNPQGTPAGWQPYLTGSVASFCIDIHQYAPTQGTGPHTYDVRSLDDAPQAPGDWEMGLLKAGYLAQLLNQNWMDSLTSAQARNLQLAVWEIVDEQLVDDTGKYVFDVLQTSGERGNFYIDNNTVAGTVNSMLDDVMAAGPAAFLGRYVALTNNVGTNNYQDFVVRVPVPGAFLLGLLGLSAAGIKLRRRA